MDARVERFPPSCALRGPACAVLLLILGGVSFARAGNVAEDLVLTIRLADLPEQITLCRFPTAIQAFGVDQAWQVQIDADANPSTGQSGIDLVIQVATAARASPCSPQSVSTAAALEVVQVRWDENSQALVETAAAPTLELDFPGNALRITTSLQPDLPPISANSVIGAVSVAYYGNNANAIGTALDASPIVSPGASSNDPAGDVADCNAECSPAAPWYPLVDMVGLEAQSTAPPPTPLRVTFALADVPASFGLCRFPDAFGVDPTLSDSTWYAFFDLDGSPGTGDAAGDEAVVFIRTNPQSQGCAATSLPAAQALSAGVARFVDEQTGYEVVDTIAVTITGDSLVVQADPTSPALAGFGSQSRVRLATAGLYETSNNEPRAAVDVLGPLQLGVPALDASNDLTECQSPCTPFVAWYAQLDLVGGMVDDAALIFASGFETP